MPYEPTTWKTGDVVTSAKLNKMEAGIANAGGSGGGALIVNIVEDELGYATLDKTWQEIRDASFCVMKQAISADQVEQVSVVSTYYISKTPSAEEGKINYIVAITSGQGELVEFTADSPDGYPTSNHNQQSDDEPQEPTGT